MPANDTTISRRYWLVIIREIIVGQQFTQFTSVFKNWWLFFVHIIEFRCSQRFYLRRFDCIVYARIKYILYYNEAIETIAEGAVENELKYLLDSLWSNVQFDQCDANWSVHKICNLIPLLCLVHIFWLGHKYTAIVPDSTFCGKKINRIDRNHLWWINIVNSLHLHDEFMRRFFSSFHRKVGRKWAKLLFYVMNAWMDSELNMHFNEMNTKFMQFSVCNKFFSGNQCRNWIIIMIFSEKCWRFKTLNMPFNRISIR